MAIFAPTAIDLSRFPAPAVIESLDFEAVYLQFKTRFLAFWELARAENSALPVIDTLSIETMPAGIIGEAWSYLRLLDRQRVNDGIRALLAPLAKGSDLDNFVAGRNLQRLTIVPATGSTAAIMEGDVALLRRYLLSFDAPSAGSAGRYLYDAWTAWPQNDDGTLGLWDARVNGRALHGRNGDTDLVITGPYGRLPTTQEINTVRTAVTDINRAPDGVNITVMAADRSTYAVSLVIEVPGIGPSPDVVQAEAVARVTAAANGRLLIGGEVPAGFLSGAAYGSNVIKVRDITPVVIAPDPYKIPVMTGCTIAVEVRS